MKTQRIITTVALAFAGLTLSQTAVNAAATAGDLLINFRTTNNSGFDLEVDLGQQSLFTTTSTLNLTFGSFYAAGGVNSGGLSSADLDTVFNTTDGGWNALSNLVWGVSGRTGSIGTNTNVWATQPLTGAQAAASGTTLLTPGGRITSYQSQFNAGGLTSPSAEQVEVHQDSEGNYTGALRFSPPTTIDFGFFNPSTEASVSSSLNKSLELYHYGNNTRTDVGTFTLTPDGTLTFTGSAVPEPSALTALAGGAGLLGMIRRRRSAAVA